MNYNMILPNDVSNGEGVCVSLFVQGCHFHCEGCFNPETWNFNEGTPYGDKTKWEIIKLIGANGIQRNFSVLGGEPLALENLEMTAEIVQAVRQAYPNITIYLWTGYTLEILKGLQSPALDTVLNTINYLIDGPFILEQKSLDLKWRGSSNQHIWKRQDNNWILIE